MNPLRPTYQGKTAGGLLKTAELVRTQYGNVEIIVTLPDGGRLLATLVVRHGERGQATALMLRHRGERAGENISMELSGQAYQKFLDLTAEAAQMIKRAQNVQEG